MLPPSTASRAIRLSTTIRVSNYPFHGYLPSPKNGPQKVNRCCGNARRACMVPGNARNDPILQRSEEEFRLGADKPGPSSDLKRRSERLPGRSLQHCAEWNGRGSIARLHLRGLIFKKGECEGASPLKLPPLIIGRYLVIPVTSFHCHSLNL